MFWYFSVNELASQQLPTPTPSDTIKERPPTKKRNVRKIAKYTEISAPVSDLEQQPVTKVTKKRFVAHVESQSFGITRASMSFALPLNAQCTVGNNATS